MRVCEQAHVCGRRANLLSPVPRAAACMRACVDDVPACSLLSRTRASTFSVMTDAYTIIQDT